MTLYTKNHAFVGNVEFRVMAMVVTPLADPAGWGNMGLQGFDEEAENFSRPTLASAKTALRKFCKAHPDVVNYFRIERGAWVEESFEDIGDDPDIVLDAEFEIEGVTEGYVRDDGTLYYEEEFTP